MNKLDEETRLLVESGIELSEMWLMGAVRSGTPKQCENALAVLEVAATNTLASQIANHMFQAQVDFDSAAKPILYNLKTESQRMFDEMSRGEFERIEFGNQDTHKGVKQ